MGLPRKLKNFALYVDGTSYLGQCEEVTLPTLSRKMEDFRGGGMNAAVGLDLGMDSALEIEITLAGWEADITDSFGAPTHDATLLRFAGALQPDDSAGVIPVEIVCRGRLSEINPGTSKSGEKTERSYKFRCSYYKETVAGKVTMEIDPVGMKEVVNGHDRMESVRAALGI